LHKKETTKTISDTNKLTDPFVVTYASTWDVINNLKKRSGEGKKVFIVRKVATFASVGVLAKRRPPGKSGNKGYYTILLHQLKVLMHLIDEKETFYIFNNI